ncbi:MAG TPA: chemotaxis response regulator protein-glutamate methylesterase [Gammaproteobacteria bacterium]|nr:chemotaxis response regulator protein-glutamate methylesterase [Gammaproteobacteria bacterium]
MPIRVLIVDDSSFFRRQIKKLIDQDKALEVVGSANDGKDAIAKVRTLKPDVVTMDIEMPIMDGIESTREIMRRFPVPILIFSSLATEGAQSTFDALEAGAVDYIPKRFEDISRNRDEVQKILCEKIAIIARNGVPAIPQKAVRVGRSPIAMTASVDQHPVQAESAKGRYKLVAIGTSTGGPVALQEILTKLPADFPLPIVMVQHMPGTFTPAFASRLDQLCAIRVKEAEQGDVLTPGTAYLAPGGKQMELKVRGSQMSLDVSESKPGFTYKPSVDVTFSSLARFLKNQVLAIILTGMGADGCKGSKELKQAGSTIWAQDKASCVVYGMPAAVFDAGITDKVLPLKEFSSHIIKQV